MVTRRFARFGEPMFLRPEDAMAALEKEGFDWRLVREYFRFTDDWLSEGQYGKMLDMALASLQNDEDRNVLLDMLDLEYAVFLEQVALQERMLGPAVCEEESVAFSERVMAYLQINANNRPSSTVFSKSARTVLLESPPGKLIHRLLGDLNTPVSKRITQQED